jgi:heat shock protein HslJ/photosystem II stability/assembly factor-like uncharacterized protein
MVGCDTTAQPDATEPAATVLPPAEEATDPATPQPTEPAAGETSSPESGTTPEGEATPEGETTPEAGDSLANTQWMLESFGPQGAETPVIEGSTITLEFDATGQAGGSGGCNSYGSEYTVEGNTITFGLVNSTLRACVDEAVTQQEAQYLAALQSAGSFELTADRLTIFYEGGEGALNFSAASPPTAGNGEGWTRTQVGDFWNVEHPADWTINDAGAGEGAVQLLGPYEGHTYQVNLSFPIGILAQTLEAWIEEQLAPLTPEQREAIEISDVEVAGVPAKKLLNFPGTEGREFEHRIYVWRSDDVNPRLITLTQTDDQPFDSAAAEALLDRFAVGIQPPDDNLSAGEPIYIGYIQMLDGQNGWAAGGTEAGRPDRILQTADGGRTWLDRTPPDLPPVNEGFDASPAGFFAPAGAGWVSYPTVSPQTEPDDLQVMMTADGGQSWTNSEPLDFSHLPMDFFIPSDIRFLNDEFGWLIAHLGAGMSHDYIAIYTTADGGQSWQRVTDPENDPDVQPCAKSGVVFISPMEGWLAGDCPGLMPSLFLYHTADGGQTWTQTTLPATAGVTADLPTMGDTCGVPQLGSIGGNTVLLMLRCIGLEQNRAQAWLYVSAEAGPSWQIYPLPASSAEFEFISPTEGWLLGSEDPSAAEQGVYHTTDGGQTWESLATVGQGGHIEFNDTRNGWIASGAMTLLHSADGGKTWQELQPVIS